MLKYYFLCITFTLVSARHFTNPIIDKLDAPDPGVVFYDGLYYAVSTTNNDEPNKFPIHVSHDLQTWELQTYVFNADNQPVWSTKVEYWAAEIHILGEQQFRVYYTTRDIESKRLAIGAAYATNILGPYHALDRPLVLDLTQDVLDSNLIQDNGRLYLIWKGSVWMYLRELQSDGLGFTDDSVHEILQNDLAWESYIIEGPWVVKRNNTFYMFYSGNEYCGTKYAVGVARALKVQGPWVKRGDPILVTNDELVGPGHCSVVKDINNVDDVMVFHAYRAGEVCVPHPRLMCAQSVAWGDDGWPYMTD